MVYRCFVIGRIYFKYDFIYGKLFSIIKFDFFCENFDVFLIDIQLFLFFRLIELCLVLYYGILEFLSFENELVISVKSIDDSVKYSLIKWKNKGSWVFVREILRFLQKRLNFVMLGNFLWIELYLRQILLVIEYLQIMGFWQFLILLLLLYLLRYIVRFEIMMDFFRVSFGGYRLMKVRFYSSLILKYFKDFILIDNIMLFFMNFIIRLFMIILILFEILLIKFCRYLGGSFLFFCCFFGFCFV